MMHKKTIEITKLNDEVKQAVLDVLVAGPANIVFVKLDGTTRQMRATLSAQLTPAIVLNETTDRPAKAANSDVRVVYDLETSDWRSFRWDKLVSVTAENTV